MNKQVNQDLKNLINWLHPNNICLNVSKTEVVLFKSSRKRTDVPLKLKLNGKILFLTKSGKYLGINIDENLNWKQQISDITIKLNKANGILSKLRYFIYRKTLKSIYHAIYWSSLGCIVVPPHSTKLYGRNSVNISAACTWNYLQKLNEYNLFY